MTELNTLNVAAATDRRDVLNRFGNALPAECGTLAEVLKHGDLDYKASRVPSYAKVDGKFVKDPESFHIIREDTNEILGRVGSRFLPVQNEEAFALAEDLVNQGVARFELLGSFRKAVPFVTVRLKHMKIGKETLMPRIFFTHGLDGSRGITAAFIADRLACTNQLPVAEKPYNIRHTKTAHNRLAIAMQLYSDFESRLKIMSEAMEAMQSRTITGKERTNFFFSVYNPSPRDMEKFEEKTLYHLDRLSVEGLGNKETEGSLWSAYNAVTEFEDWSKGFARKGTKLNNRMESMFFGDAHKRKYKAFSEAMALIS